MIDKTFTPVQPPAAPVALETIYAALSQAQDCIRGETPEDVSDQEAREDTIDKVRDAMRLIEHMQAQPQPDPHPGSSAGNEDIALAEKMLSDHIEEFHDFDYQPHEVPPELASLRAIQHHLIGSMMPHPESK